VKELFRGYYRLQDEEINKIWETGFISLDTNVLCNFYRYSEETRNELFKAIAEYSGQLWLPYHVASEFHKNRPGVISEQIKIYETTIEGMKGMEDNIVKNSKTPHLSTAVVERFKEVIHACITDLQEKREFYLALLQNDSIISEITELFDGKVGIAFTEQELAAIEKEGDSRYKNEMPPGYKDAKKSDNKYGDLIIWKELIAKSTAENVPFIFIMDDLKEDWWLRIQGKTLSPRPELLQELYKASKQVFHLYDPHRFLQFAAKTKAVKQTAIDEVKEIGNATANTSFASPKIIDDILKTYNYTDFIEKITALNKTGMTIDDFTTLKTIQRINDLIKSTPDLTKMRTLMDWPYVNYLEKFKIEFNKNIDEKLSDDDNHKPDGKESSGQTNNDKKN
jgi:hypothetical protein